MLNIHAVDGRIAVSIPEIIECAYAARMAGDVEGVMAFIGDGVEYQVLGSIAGQPVTPLVCGKPELGAFFNGLFSRWVWLEMRILRKIVDGNLAAVEVTGTMLHKVSGQKFDTTLCEILEFQDDRIIRIRSFVDTFTFVRVAGLAM